MSKVRQKDSKAELALRRELHALGFRYRLHDRLVFGTPDICVRSRRIAIFVDGDLWHGNPTLPARRGRQDFAALFPTRTEWWLAKISKNIRRDWEVRDKLECTGWIVIRVWESDVLDDPKATAQLVYEKLAGWKMR